MTTTPQQFWMVAGNGPSSHRHDSYDSAQTEAQRLARLHPGHCFYVMEAIEAIEKREFHTIQFRAKPIDDGVPF